jgi:hypothetical protein
MTHSYITPSGKEVMGNYGKIIGPSKGPSLAWYESPAVTYISLNKKEGNMQCPLQIASS